MQRRETGEKAMPRRRLLLLAAAAYLLLVLPAAAEKRVALIIGNSDYVHATPLPNPMNDATDMAAAQKAAVNSGSKKVSFLGVVYRNLSVTEIPVSNVELVGSLSIAALARSASRRVPPVRSPASAISTSRRWRSTSF